MKVLLAWILIVGSLFFVFKNRTIDMPAQSLITSHPAPSLSKDTVSFVLQIQPILVNHCSPCHFTGGKMYEKLPFDKGQTIINHEVALLRRINDVKEKASFKNLSRSRKNKMNHNIRIFLCNKADDKYRIVMIR